MKIILGKTVKIKELNNNTDPIIMNYLHENGIIKGQKIIKDYHCAHIIEFQDYTRVWILPTELDFI